MMDVNYESGLHTLKIKLPDHRINDLELFSGLRGLDASPFERIYVHRRLVYRITSQRRSMGMLLPVDVMDSFFGSWKRNTYWADWVLLDSSWGADSTHVITESFIWRGCGCGDGATTSRFFTLCQNSTLGSLNHLSREASWSRSEATRINTSKFALKIRLYVRWIHLSLWRKSQEEKLYLARKWFQKALTRWF